MKNTIVTILFCLASTVCAFFAMIYPAWFQQNYRAVTPNVYQSFGIWAFYSTQQLSTPFYASQTTLKYSDFCDSTTSPNWMLGGGSQFREVVCGKIIMGIQGVVVAGCVLSVISLIASIAAVYNPAAGIPERIVSGGTLASSLLILIALIMWALQIQQKLYTIDFINTAYGQCDSKKTGKDWSCWFYGYSFWVAIASVVCMLVTMYASSAGRAEKIRYFRKEYEADLAVAMQASIQSTPQFQNNNNPTVPYHQQPGGNNYTQAYSPEHLTASNYQPSNHQTSNVEYNRFDSAGSGYQPNPNTYQRQTSNVRGGVV